jgi:putative sterol carrier protein
MINMDKIKFPSEEWIKAYKEELNKNTAYEEAAKDWEGDFLFIVTPSEGLDKEYAFYVDLWHGKCRDAYMVPDRTSKTTAFIFEGPYSNWKKLIAGQIDPIQGLLTGKFKLKGNMAKVLRYTKAASELVKTAAKVPTEFI